MPDKKNSPLKPAAQAATARPQPAKKAPVKSVAKAKTPAKPAPKPAAKKAADVKPAAAAKKAAAKPAPAKAAPPKADAARKTPPAPKAQSKPAAAPTAPATPPKAKAAPKAAKPAPKADAKAKPAPAPKPAKAAKPAAPKPEAKPEKAAKPEKPAKPPKAEKPPKPPKPPKAEKPPKLAPVAAALAKPMPAKPLAVAAGRAQPIIRSMAPPPPRQAPRPLAAPKPAAEPESVGDSQPVPAFKAKTNGSAKGMVLVGAVGGAFGVKGEVRLRAFTDRPDGVISYGPLYGEDGKVVLRPKTWRALRDGVAVTAPEIKTREEAEALKGLRLFVPRTNLPPTAEDEFYIVDLLGCRAEALDGAVLGEVVAVWNFGAGDIIEYRPPNGGPNVRVTFTKQTAPLVDLPGKRVVLDPPAPEPVGK